MKKQLKQLANGLGIVEFIFQITDDILDLSSDAQTLGKEAGKDILEGTYTLPVLIALSKDKQKKKNIKRSKKFRNQFGRGHRGIQ